MADSVKVIKIQVRDEFSRELTEFARQLNSAERELDDFDRHARNAGGGMGNLGNVVRSIDKGFMGMVTRVRDMGLAFNNFTQAVSHTAAMFDDLNTLGATAERSKMALIALSGSAEAYAAQVSAIQRATRGMVTESEAAQMAYQLQRFGLADTAADMEKFVETVSIVGAVNPQLGSTSDAINQIQLTLSNMSFMRLDQLGISAGVVRERMKELKEETSGLTDEQAFGTAVMEQLNEQADILGPGILEVGSGWERLNTHLREFKDDVGVGVTQMLDEWIPAFEELGTALSDPTFLSALISVTSIWAGNKVGLGVSPTVLEGAGPEVPPNINGIPFAPEADPALIQEFQDNMNRMVVDRLYLIARGYTEAQIAAAPNVVDPWRAILPPERYRVIEESLKINPEMWDRAGGIGQLFQRMNETQFIRSFSNPQTGYYPELNPRDRALPSASFADPADAVAYLMASQFGMQPSTYMRAFGGGGDVLSMLRGDDYNRMDRLPRREPREIVSEGFAETLTREGFEMGVLAAKYGTPDISTMFKTPGGTLGPEVGRAPKITPPGGDLIAAGQLLGLGDDMERADKAAKSLSGTLERMPKPKDFGSLAEMWGLDTDTFDVDVMGEAMDALRTVEVDSEAAAEATRLFELSIGAATASSMIYRDSMADLAQQYKDGTVSTEEFVNAARGLSDLDFSEIDRMAQNLVDTGDLSGAQDFIDQFADMDPEQAERISGAMGTLGDALVDLVPEGKGETAGFEDPIMASMGIIDEEFIGLTEKWGTPVRETLNLATGEFETFSDLSIKEVEKLEKELRGLENVKVTIGVEVTKGASREAGTPSTPGPGQLPEFAEGGYTGAGSNKFLAWLHQDEFVIPGEDARGGRSSSSGPNLTDGRHWGGLNNGRIAMRTRDSHYQNLELLRELVKEMGGPQLILDGRVMVQTSDNMARRMNRKR